MAEISSLKGLWLAWQWQSLTTETDLHMDFLSGLGDSSHQSNRANRELSLCCQTGFLHLRPWDSDRSHLTGPVCNSLTVTSNVGVVLRKWQQEMGLTRSIVRGRPHGRDGGSPRGGVRSLSVPLYRGGRSHKVILRISVLQKRRKTHINTFFSAIQYLFFSWSMSLSFIFNLWTDAQKYTK